MQTNQRRYPSWLPIPPILKAERGKIMYGGTVFYITVSEDGVQSCLLSIANEIMKIVANHRGYGSSST